MNVPIKPYNPPCSALSRQLLRSVSLDDDGSALCVQTGADIRNKNIQLKSAIRRLEDREYPDESFDTIPEPFGQALVVMVGLVIAGMGVWQIHKAWTEKFRRKLNLEALDAAQTQLTVRVCGTLAVLARQPYGDVLLSVVAAGLVSYAVYMAVIFRYRRFLGA